MGVAMDGEKFSIGALVFIETHRRLLGDEFGAIPKPLTDDSFSMSGYCLDAPMLIPAGSMFDEAIPEVYGSIPSLTYVNRDEP